MKTVLFLVAFIATALSYAADENGAPPPPPPAANGERPPQADGAACQNRNAGAAVEIKTPDGRTLRGKCQLVFVPERPQGPPPSGGKPQP